MNKCNRNPIDNELTVIRRVERTGKPGMYKESISASEGCRPVTRSWRETANSDGNISTHLAWFEVISGKKSGELYGPETERRQNYSFTWITARICIQTVTLQLNPTERFHGIIVNLHGSVRIPKLLLVSQKLVDWFHSIKQSFLQQRNEPLRFKYVQH